MKALLKFCQLKEKQFLYLQLIRVDNINPFLNLIRKCSNKNFKQRLPASMKFYVNVKGKVQEAYEIASKDPEQEQKITMMNDLVEDAKFIKRDITSKSIKTIPKQTLNREVMRILVTSVMLDLKKLYGLQEMMFRFMKRGLNMSKHENLIAAINSR